MISDIIDQMKVKCQKSIDSVKKEFSHVRTGRANTSMLDDIRVEYYDQQMPINQLATMSVPEPRVILISPWDVGSVSAIDKAIQKANLGLNPNSDGKFIRLVFPELTEDRRKEFVKIIHSKTEEGRVAVRNLRRDANEHAKKLMKDHEISEDDEKRALDEIQKITDDIISKMNHLQETKEKEILEV